MIIGIGGGKFAGKNTLAEYFATRSFKELSFALPLKKILAEALQLPFKMFDDAEEKETQFPIPYEITWGELNRILILARAYGKIDQDASERVMRRWHIDEKHHATPREIAQYVGTDLFRQNVDLDFWCRAFMKEARGYSNVVVSDCRFSNERQAVREAGGKLVLVKRPMAWTSDPHISENSLGEESEYNIVFNNDGTPENLRSQAETWYNNIHG